MTDPGGATIIDIPAHLRSEIQRIEIIRQHYTSELQKLGQELREKLHIAHGVDIAEPGWRLDAEGGKLAYVPPVVQHPSTLTVMPSESPEEKQEA